MGWFKVHSDDLHKVEGVPPSQADESSMPVNIKTRDVKVFIARYSNDSSYAMHPNSLASRYIRGEVMTKTNARDAFIKGVYELMNAEGFDPKRGYSIYVTEKTIKEVV